MKISKLSIAGILLLSLSIQAQQSKSQSNVRVFDENTSFEKSLMRSRSEMARVPAALDLKFRVVSVRRELGLTQAEMNKAPQDVIINGGSSEGLSKGMVLNVVRKVPIIDPYLDNRQKELSIPFAKVKIIHADENLAVARVHALDSLTEGPSLGVRGILIGDYLSLR